MTNKEAFNDRLKYIGCTKKELSKKAGVCQEVILRYARHREDVSPFIEEKIEKAMDELYKEKLYGGIV